MNVALVTGGTAGLGRALVVALLDRGWQVVTDGRDADRIADLRVAVARHQPDGLIAVQGDITDPHHRRELCDVIDELGRLDLLVHNASVLGPQSGATRYRELGDVTLDDLQQLWRTNVGAPLILTGELLRELRAANGVLLSISSDAAVEHYQGWGLYSASKAALDQLTLIFGTENPELAAYAVDPGDMRTAMHQEWFPGEDISDRPLPETVVPHLLALLAERPANGRYRAADVPVPAPAGA